MLYKGFEVCHPASQAYRKKYNRDEAEALPSGVTCGLYFQNSEAHMQKAIDKGEVVEARREKGVIYYAFRCLVVGTEDGKQEEQTATASKKLTPEEYSTMREVFKGLKVELRAFQEGGDR